MIERLEILKTLWDTPSSRRGWTLKRRQEQSLRCRQTQPWKKSTGPCSLVGKARSSLNGKTSLNKRDSQRFDVLASLLMELEKLQRENFELRAKIERYERTEDRTEYGRNKPHETL